MGSAWGRACGRCRGCRCGAWGVGRGAWARAWAGSRLTDHRLVGRLLAVRPEQRHHHALGQPAAAATAAAAAAAAAAARRWHGPREARGEGRGRSCRGAGGEGAARQPKRSQPQRCRRRLQPLHGGGGGGGDGTGRRWRGGGATAAVERSEPHAAQRGEPHAGCGGVVERQVLLHGGGGGGDLDAHVAVDEGHGGVHLVRVGVRVEVGVRVGVGVLARAVGRAKVRVRVGAGQHLVAVLRDERDDVLVVPQEQRSLGHLQGRAWG